jgi:hypothetical protein
MIQPMAPKIVGRPTIQVLLEVGLSVTRPGAKARVTAESFENVGTPTVQVTLEGPSNALEVRG